MSATPLRQARLDVVPSAPPFSLPITMAFQPIVDAGSRDVFAYEALVRGADGQGALQVLSAVDRSNRRGFDRACRSTALGLAAELGLKHRLAALSINFMPNAVADPGLCGEQMVEACRAADFPAERIIFEFTESEPVEDMDHLAQVIRAYRAMGFRSAIDDFGAGHSGLTLLARFQPDIVKLDMELVRGIDSDRVRRAIVASIRRMCDDLGVVIVAEGIETAGEYAALRDLGVSLLQGYLFARPQVAALPEPCWPGPR